jgi:hypothetical protein
MSYRSNDRCRLRRPEFATLQRAAALAELTRADLLVTNAVGPIESASADDAFAMPGVSSSRLNGL